MEFTTPVRTYTTNAAVGEKRLVKLSGAKVIVNTATATDDPVGVSQYDGADQANIAVRHLGDGGTVEVMAAGAITAGVDVYAAADGKIQALPAGAGTYRRVGKSLEAADGDGDIIEMLPYNDGKTVTQ